MKQLYSALTVLLSTSCDQEKNLKGIAGTLKREESLVREVRNNEGGESKQRRRQK